MTSAAFFLITRNLKNRIVRSVLRLRQPRYIAGAVLAGLYFWSMFFRHARARDMIAFRNAGATDVLAIVVSVIAFVVLLGSWGLPSDSPAFIFSEAEIQFFFAGPVSRRGLLGYKTIRNQIQSLFSAVIFSLLVFRGSHFLGVWIAFVALDVYTTFVSFARARLKLAGISWIWRFVAVFAAFIAIISIAARQFRGSASVILDAVQQPKSAALMKTVASIFWRPPLGTILFIPRLFATTVYGTDPVAVIESTAVLIAGALVLFFLSTRLDVSFEDASIVSSQRALARRARMRSLRSSTSATAIHRYPPLFKLAERGRPEVAIVWKNLIGAMRLSSFPMIALVMAFVLLAAAAVFRNQQGVADTVGMMGMMITALFMLLGPQAVRSDLRVDILRLDVIKTFPLSAEVLLASELAAPLVVIVVFELLILVISVSILNFFGHQFTFFTSPMFVVAALVFIIPISAIQLLIQNAGIVLFPAWSVSVDAVRGFTAMGQRFLLLLGNIITLAIAVLPAALLFAAALWVTHTFLPTSPLTILVATIPAAAVLVAEIFIAHKFVASQLEDIDIANDLETLA